MLLKRSLIIIFLLCLLSSTVLAKEITIHPTDSKNGQDAINKAIEKVNEAGGGTVYLDSGTHWIDNTIIMRSNVELTGDPDAIIKVSESSSQWFTGSKGIISCNEVLKNVKIHGFQINGNCINLPRWMANTPGHDKDCEKLIILHGNSNDFAKNIKVYDMQLYDSYSDGIYIYYAENVECYDNFISNCQHEGIFWSVVLNSRMYNNQLAGITSDCARLDNCIDCIVEDNIFFSYSGSHANGAWKHGESGLQVGDAQSSHGYDARNKPTTTQNIEIRNNTFANNGLEAIRLGKNSDNNVYIHDNKFIGQKELEQMGIPVDVESDYVPSAETSHKVFSSIFDILNVNYCTQVSENETIILPEGVKKTPSKVLGKVEYYKIGDNYTTFVKIPSKGLSEVQYEVNGLKATHTIMIGEKTSEGVVFTETSIWEGELENSRDALKLPGKVKLEDIEVKCITPTDTISPVLETSNTEFEPFIINPGIFVILGIVFFGVIIIGFELRHLA